MHMSLRQCYKVALRLLEYLYVSDLKYKPYYYMLTIFKQHLLRKCIKETFLLILLILF